MLVQLVVGDRLLEEQVVVEVCQLVEEVVVEACQLVVVVYQLEVVVCQLVVEVVEACQLVVYRPVVGLGAEVGPGCTEGSLKGGSHLYGS